MLLDVRVFSGILLSKKSSDVAADQKRDQMVLVSLVSITMSGQYGESAPTYCLLDCQLKPYEVVQEVGRESNIVPRVPAVL